uniref:Uncharacterized protein n=1 Tax=Anguilla anguilla TaxID=7936 RepID=A0A0E9PQ44_ANGAN
MSSVTASFVHALFSQLFVNVFKTLIFLI